MLGFKREMLENVLSRHSKILVLRGKKFIRLLTQKVKKNFNIDEVFLEFKCFKRQLEIMKSKLKPD